MTTDFEPVPDFLFPGYPTAEADGLVLEGLESGVFKTIILEDFKTLNLESPVVEKVSVVLAVGFEEPGFLRVEERDVDIAFVVKSVAIHHSDPNRRLLGEVGACLSKIRVDVLLRPAPEGRDRAPCHTGGSSERAKHTFGRTGHLPSRPGRTPGVTRSEGHAEVGCHSGGRFPGVVMDFRRRRETVEDIFTGAESVAMEGRSGSSGIWIGWVAAKMAGSV